jgi:anti-anti-sigma factor
MGVGFRVPLRTCAIERATLMALAEQCAQALDRARLYRAEHQVAETLQRSLLPQRLPQLPRLALDARYLPGAEGVQAGGDWYDVIELDEHRVAIAVGDVVGQGAAAAAVMGQLRSALAAALLQGHGPAAALELLDRFAARVPGTRASTAACVTLDWAAGRVRWARAGHPPPLLVDADGVRHLDGDGHDDDLSDDLLLAMGEAAANAVEHAYRDGAAGDWYYEVARCGDGSVAVVVQDWGSWRPPPADPGFRGRGVEFVRHLADEVSFERRDTGTTVRFRLGVPTSGPERDHAAAAAPRPDEPDGPVVAVPGELDLAKVEAVRAELFGQVAGLPDGGRLTLDLRPTTYLPSAGIGLLLEVLQHARARGIDLRILTDPAGLPARAFALAGLDLHHGGVRQA